MTENDTTSQPRVGGGRSWFRPTTRFFVVARGLRPKKNHREGGARKNCWLCKDDSSRIGKDASSTHTGSNGGHGLHSDRCVPFPPLRVPLPRPPSLVVVHLEIVVVHQ